MVKRNQWRINFAEAREGAAILPAGFLCERGQPRLRSTDKDEAFVFTDRQEVINVIIRLRAAGWACCAEPPLKVLL